MSMAEIRRSKSPPHRVSSKDDSHGSSQSSMFNISSLSIVALLVAFFALIIFVPRESNDGINNYNTKIPNYNSTYPLSPSKPPTSDGIYEFPLAVVTDLDHASKLDDKPGSCWRSYLRRGVLRLPKSDPSKSEIVWETENIELGSCLSHGGRSMELSDLVVFDGELLTVDDRTGVVYKIRGKKAIAWVLLADGNGNEAKGFKGEWLAVKDGVLYVGGLGKEWTTIQGEFVNHHPMWIKTVTHYGFVQHYNWTQIYIDLRAAAGIHYPGYMIHESGRWSPIHRKWFFIPRRASKETYTEEADERRASNIMLIATENFKHIETRHFGELSLTRGVSAFQFIPGTDDRLIIALKSEEDRGVIASYFLIFDIDGRVIVPETKLDGDYKFEGIEFV